ncbi:hypothetical protein [Janthinobacterium sp. 17J80-10]|uniref:hypothetical protein n=1 Tax=Janthinobacterium sp. 17J80-10 TaxID=2497863 RepID=UPI0010058A90|nr:hypothetical protein [Janthinobacterium sp. 17J80-10]QAU32799.1 hypothetical protein EKL02_00665 [Janthinobacterium sp. 17J80-10]
MANLTSSLPTSFHPGYVATSIQLRVGRREVSIGRDCRTRYYRAHPLLECNPGVAPGHLHILLLRRWLIVLSKAR